MPGTCRPEELDIVCRGADYVIFRGSEPLRTPAGRELCHADSRLLENILRELLLRPAGAPRRVGAYALFVLRRDSLEQGQDPAAGALRSWAEGDALVRRLLQEESGPGAAGRLDQLLEGDRGGLALVLSGISALAQALNAFLMEMEQGTLDLVSRDRERFMRFLERTYGELRAHEKAAVCLLAAAHGAGVVLPLLLALRRITPSEYASGLLAVRLGGAAEGGEAQGFSGLWEDACRVLEDISFHERPRREPAGLAELIRGGESFSLEFKSSLRRNLHTGKNDAAIEHACLKTLAAFLNSAGGTLLVGVRDDGTVSGLAADALDSDDKVLRHFWNLAKDSLGQDACAFIRARLEQVAGGQVLAAECATSSRPVFLRQRGGAEEFFIRIGPSSASLGIQEALRYIKSRFPRQDQAPA